MTSAECPKLQAYLSRVRLRIWIDGVVLLLARALWWSAAILLGGGLVSVFAGGVSWQLGLLAALAPMVIALVLAAFRRPSIETAAVIADRALGFGDLLVSAWDQLGTARGRRPAARDLVLQQAERAAETAPSPLARLQPRPRSQRWLVPLALALAGLFLQLTPEGPNAPAVSGTGSAGEPGQSVRADRGFRSPQLLDLQQALSRASDEADSVGTSSRSAQVRGAGPGAPDPADARIARPTGREPSDELRFEDPAAIGLARDAPVQPGPTGVDRASGDAGGASPDDGDKAGLGEPTPMAESSAVEAVELEVRHATLPRVRGDIVHSAGTAPLSAEVPGPSSRPAPAGPVPPSERVESMYEAGLRPALVTYTRRYLNQLERLP